METLIVGAGGHGRVVLDAIRAAGQYLPVAFLDADPSLAGTRIAGLEVMGQINALPRLRQKKIRHAIVAIGDCRSRQSYARMLLDQGFELINAVHPAAVVSPTAALGHNCVIAAGAVIGTEAKICNSVIVNTGAVVDHECTVEEAAHICPGALLAGRVQVQEGAFVGLGAKVIQCLTVGRFATVGAGAVVIRDVPDFATVVGTPARVIKLAQQQNAA
jgi:UDP-perosamine 4-acetyltransferase